MNKSSTFFIELCPTCVYLYILSIPLRLGRCFYFFPISNGLLSRRLNYMASEFQPRSYHVTNVALHVAATGLFAVLARTLTPHARLARTAAPLLFAAHPIHTEAVAGVVGRADVGAAIFFLGALLSYMRYCGCSRGNVNGSAGGRVGRKAWLGAALVSATLSMLTKEHGITALAVCAAYHIFVHAKLRPRELLSILTEVSPT